MDDRREIPRWPINARAKIKWAGQSEFVDCRIDDMSLKGMCLTLEDPLPQTSQELKVELDVSWDLDFEAGVGIPWGRQSDGRYQYGIAFHTLKDQDRDKIYEYISDHFSHEMRDRWWGN